MKTALVTGASRGIGHAVAWELARRGWLVWATARSAERLQSLAQEVEAKATGRVISHPADLTRADARQALRERLMAETPALDALILNAAEGRFPSILQTRDEDLETLWRLNVEATFALTRDLREALVRSPTPRVVGITSDVARRTFEGGAVYCMTKYAQDAFFLTLRKEWRADGVRVSVVMPGLTDTDFGGSPAGAQHKAEWLRPEDVAQVVAFVLEAPPHVVIDEVLLHPFCQSWP